MAQQPTPSACFRLIRLYGLVCFVMLLLLPCSSSAQTGLLAGSSVGTASFTAEPVSKVALLFDTVASRLPPEPSLSPAWPQEIIFRDYLAIPMVGQYGKRPIHRDTLEHLLISKEWQTPQENEWLKTPSGRRRRWSYATADHNGIVKTSMFRGGYATISINSTTERIMLLKASGHASVFVNGQPHTGDPYQLGWLQIPVQIRVGQNDFIFHIAGNTLQAKLVKPNSRLQFISQDTTLPTLPNRTTPAGKKTADSPTKKPGEKTVETPVETAWAAIPILNTTNETQHDIVLTCYSPSGKKTETTISTLAPLSVYKAAFRLPAVHYKGQKNVSFKLHLTQASTQQSVQAAPSVPIVSTSIQVAFDPTDKAVMRTYQSKVDHSIQRYSFKLATKNNNRNLTPALVMTLHNQGVACDKYLNYYQAKKWAHLLSPSNRRPYGFDWEDWGRLDALEALQDFRSHHKYDPRRVSVTGHSMGGHGVWRLGTLYPDTFTALAPSGGWLSYQTYGSGIPKYKKPNQVESMVLRGFSHSDTKPLLANLLNSSVYMLHGTKDTQVPITHARMISQELVGRLSNFSMFYKQNASHWWGKSTCDWDPMFEFMKSQKQTPSQEILAVDFSTTNPEISNQSHWIRIEAQTEQLALSRIQAAYNRKNSQIAVRTKNIDRFSIDLQPGEKNIYVKINSQPQRPFKSSKTKMRVWFTRHKDHWHKIEHVSLNEKGTHRYGTLKSVFNHNFVFVYSTQGTDDENQWSLAKARYDAETFWYRGNGSVEIISDQDYLAKPVAKNRNIILYGNADTNSAWPALLSTCPIQVRRGSVRIGIRPETGDDLACLFVRPRPGSTTALVGVVSGTGLKGFKMTNRLRYFIPGIAYPDFMLFGPDALSAGTSDIRAWGFFGYDWTIKKSEIGWRDASL